MLSSDESDSLDDESDKIGSDGLWSDSRSSVTYYLYLRFDDSIVGVNVLGSDVFAPTGVKSKSGRLLAVFWRSNS